MWVPLLETSPFRPSVPGWDKKKSTLFRPLFVYHKPGLPKTSRSRNAGSEVMFKPRKPIGPWPGSSPWFLWHFGESHANFAGFSASDFAATPLQRG